MLTPQSLISRLLDPIRRAQRDRELDDEIEAHLAQLTDDHIARGLSPADARLAARKMFGGVDQVKALYRDQRGLPWLDAAWQDLRFALRLCARERGFALMAIVVLALGIGVNNMFFTLVYAHTMRGLPIDRPEHVLYVSTFDDRTRDAPVSRLDFEDLRSSQQSFQHLAAFANAAVALGDEGRAPDRVDAAYVTADAFDVVPIRPLIGRVTTAEDDRPGAEPVVLLGASVWERRYGGDPTILGRTVLVNGAPVTVAGVIP
jgi:hypothetical protein